MPVYTFVEMTPVPACEHTGAYMEFLADNEEAAVAACLYSCRLSNGKAETVATIGGIARIVYPSGKLAEANCWVLLGPNRQRQWYAERGLPDPNAPVKDAREVALQRQRRDCDNQAKAEARRYVARIRNAAKQRYATEYLRFLEAGGEGKEPLRPKELSAMAAQAVRLQLYELLRH